MQSLGALTADDFKAKGKIPVSKLEVYIDPAWINICNLGGENYLISANYSKGQLKQTYKPVAATFSAVIDNVDGLFHPQNNDSAYKDYFKVGNRIRFSTGFTQNGTDYLWQWFIGIISAMDVDNTNRRVQIQGFDYMQYLSEVRLKSPDNYWGAIATESVVADQFGYSMPGACNGIYIAYLDGSPIYNMKQWAYDRNFNDFVFMPEYVPTANGVDNLLIYYFTDQVVENVIADLLVSAGLYANQGVALAAMDYTATGVTLERVWFLSGSILLNAIKKLCERVDYRFYFTYDGIPVFKPIAEVERWENRVFTFTKNLIAEPDYFENIDEIKNNIIIEGEKYPASDAYFVGTKRYAALVTHNTDLGVADSAWDEYPFTIERYDTDNIWDNANQPRLTCNTPGRYKISGFFVITSNAAGIRGIRIRLNGVTGYAEHKEDAEAGTSTTVRAQTVLDLVEGDYVELQFYQSSGGVISILGTNDEDGPEFEMERIA